jgi:hypothetical protein
MSSTESDADPKKLLAQFTAAIAAATPMVDRPVAKSNEILEPTEKIDGDGESELPAKSVEATSSETGSGDGHLSFIEVYVSTHGSRLHSKQRAQIIFTLLICGVTDLGELLEVDQAMLNDVCAHDKHLTHVHKMRTRQFLERQATTHTGFKHFATPPINSNGGGGLLSHAADAGVISTAADSTVDDWSTGTRRLSNRPRNSGITLPAEFVAGCNESLGSITEHPAHGMPANYRDPEPTAAKRTRHSQSMRYIGGVSDRQRQSDAFANSGGGPGGLGPDVNIHSIKSKHALEVEHKTRLKLEVLAVTTNPTWDGHVRPWREFSADFTRQMASAGHDIVCRPGYTETAQFQSWSPERIVEGRKFVWNQLLVCCKDSARAKNALLMAGPECDGETAFHQLEINNKISGHALKQQLDDELLNFAPLGREEPPDMIVRFDLLLTAYLDIESADLWSPEKKIKKILTLLRHWEDPKVTVDLQRDKYIAELFDRAHGTHSDSTHERRTPHVVHLSLH